MLQEVPLSKLNEVQNRNTSLLHSILRQRRKNNNNKNSCNNCHRVSSLEKEVLKKESATKVVRFAEQGMSCFR